MWLIKAPGQSSKTNSQTRIRNCASINLQREASEITWREGQMIDCPPNGTSLGFLCSILNFNQSLHPFLTILAFNTWSKHFLNNNLSCIGELKTVAIETNHTRGLFSSGCCPWFSFTQLVPSEKRESIFFLIIRP